MTIWMNREDLMALPTKGLAWDEMEAIAGKYQGGAHISDPNSQDNNGCLAAALVSARTKNTDLKSIAMVGINTVIEIAKNERYIELANNQPNHSTALALSRNLPAFVIASELIEYKDWINSYLFRRLLTTPCLRAPSTVIETHEIRPNNWGLHAGFARACVYAYDGDTWGLSEVARIFRTFVGESNDHADFVYGGPYGSRDFSWQIGPNYVGINPSHSMIDGHSVDGVQPDDQRRAGSFAWPPPTTNYAWEALQGAVATAWVLYRNGYPDVFRWADSALYRSVRWNTDIAEFPPTGDDRWINWILSYVGFENLILETPTTPGKNIGFTDWTHQRVIL